MKAVGLMAACGVMALMAGTASAATITQNFAAPQSENLTDPTATATFDRFDASQGTLTGVVLRLAADFTTFQWFKAMDSLNSRFPAELSGSLDDSLFHASSSLFDGAHALLAGGAYETITTTVPGEYVESARIERSGVIEFLFSDAADLAKFVGSDTFDIDLGVSTEWEGQIVSSGIFTSQSSRSTAGFGLVTHHGFSATLTYDFEAPAPVPLPAAGVLLLTAMGGLGAVGARRRASKTA